MKRLPTLDNLRVLLDALIQLYFALVFRRMWNPKLDTHRNKTRKRDKEISNYTK